MTRRGIANIKVSNNNNNNNNVDNDIFQVHAANDTDNVRNSTE